MWTSKNMDLRQFKWGMLDNTQRAALQLIQFICASACANQRVGRSGQKGGRCTATLYIATSGVRCEASCKTVLFSHVGVINCGGPTYKTLVWNVDLRPIVWFIIQSEIKYLRITSFVNLRKGNEARPPLIYLFILRLQILILLIALYQLLCFLINAPKIAITQFSYIGNTAFPQKSPCSRFQKVLPSHYNSYGQTVTWITAVWISIVHFPFSLATNEIATQYNRNTRKYSFEHNIFWQSEFSVNVQTSSLKWILQGKQTNYVYIRVGEYQSVFPHCVARFAVRQYRRRGTNSLKPVVREAVSWPQ
jgi:hypothetical protein